MRMRALPLILALVLVACEGPLGPEGPMGPAGSQGPAGSNGATGPAGQDFPGPAPAAYTAADGILGGAAYSEWWTTDAGGPGAAPATTAGKDFYRCKACHGWDGLGNAGSYANRTGQSTLKSSRPDVSAVNLRTTMATANYQAMYDLVIRTGARGIDAKDNKHPDFSSVLSTGQVWNIVKFVREEWIDPSDLYDLQVTGPVMYVDYVQSPPVVVAPTLTYTNIGKKGDAAAGTAIYAAKCAGCHGATGMFQSIEGMSLGEFFRTKPHEAWFKAKFGAAGAGMVPGLVTATKDMQDLYAALSDKSKYPDAP